MIQEQTPTPETDALREEIWNHSYVDGSDFSHMLDHARKMERERDEAREKIKFSREWSAAIADIADDLRSELAAVTEQRDRLAKACDQYSEDEILCKLQEIDSTAATK